MTRYSGRHRLNVRGSSAEESKQSPGTYEARRKRFAPENTQHQLLGATMLTSDAQTPSPGGGLPLVAAADLQDHLMVASHDLERLQRLLEDAGEALMGHFYGASNQMNVLRDEAPKVNLDTAPIKEALQALAGAITALQFQDMATQLIAHTQRRLRNCADRIARDAMGDDEDGEAIVEDAPMRPTPVTQDEMDAGSIDLF